MLKRSSRSLVVLGVLFSLSSIFVYFLLVRHRFKIIVVHHTAFDKGGYRKIWEIQKKRHPGWKEIAYHLILSNGTEETPPGYLRATSRYRWLWISLATRNKKCNITGVHICIVGNYEEHPVPDELKPAIGHAIRLLQKKYGIPDDKILFHRDCSPTSCPGKYITKKELLRWVHELADECPEDVKRQQRRVIDFTWVLIIKYAGIILILISLTLWLFETATGKRRFKPSPFPSQVHRKS